MSLAPNPSRRDDRRETILDVARDCFLADGFAATSMSTIAARLGGSKGTLYNYFKNKEDLFAAMIQRQCAEVLEAMYEVGAEDADVRARLLGLTRGLLTRLVQPDAVALNRLVIAESERFPELGRIFYECGPRRGQLRMAEHLKALMDAGKLREADPTVAADQLKDLTVGNCIWQKLWGAEPQMSMDDMHAYLARGVDIFLRAYAP